MKKVTILGSTGSIGSQTLEVIEENTSDFEVVGVTCGHNIAKFRNILNKFSSIKFACCEEKEDYEVLSKEYPNLTFYYGDEGLISIIKASKPNLVVNALVGFAGFIPSLTVIEEGIDLALSNKESLVVGGDLINEALAKSKSHLYAIDSEHTALGKCLEGHSKEEVKYLVITASGGSLRDLPKEELKNVTVEKALKHPSWSMGKKITIDSATMMNKGFEVLEAMHLFHYPLEQIKILLHDESLIHSLVEFVDNSFSAEIGPNDMKTSISYALYGNTRHKVKTKELDLSLLSGLHFRKLDLDFYPCLKLAFRAIKEGGSSPCVLNAANEWAVYAFLDKKISYLDIAKYVEIALDKFKIIAHPTKDDLVLLNKEVRSTLDTILEGGK
jgi:1-deoxy-D-xylulose-5-phosphate reductoisomerase